MFKYFTNTYNKTVNFQNLDNLYDFIITEKYQGHPLPEIDD